MSVAAIHATPQRGVLAVTGGGAGLLAELLTTAGASATVLEAHVPYAAHSMRDFLGTTPEQACCAQTARALAMRCFLRALELEGDFGFAITAALATNRARRGRHGAHLAFQDAGCTHSWDLPLDRRADRRQQEQEVTAAGLEALAFALGVAECPAMAGASSAAGEYRDLLLGRRMHVARRQFGALLPGAFNPLHDGHRAMREDASRRLGVAVGYELCIANVDKPPLDYVALRDRLRQFAPTDVVVTNTPTFVAKAHAMGGATFVVGVDTINRIALPRYYGGERSRDEAFAELRALGCRFLVYGRVAAGAFKTLADLHLPPDLAALCAGVSEAEFRYDLSSTQLRRERTGVASPPKSP